MKTLAYLAFTFFALGSPAIAQAQVVQEERIVGIQSVPDYDGTADFFLLVDFRLRDCAGWPVGVLQEMSTERTGDRLRVTVQGTSSDGGCGLTILERPVRYIIPVARFFPTGTALPSNLLVEVVLVSDGNILRADTVQLQAKTRPERPPMRLESGSWYPSFSGIENPMLIERRGATIRLSWAQANLGQPGWPAFEWAPPGSARAWVVEGVESREFLRAPVFQMSPELVTSTQGEFTVGRFPQVDNGGELYAAIISPTRMYLSLPDGQMIEATRNSHESGTILIASPFTNRWEGAVGLQGEWHWIGMQRSFLRGQRLSVGAASSQDNQYTAEWSFRFDRGGGRVWCDHIECTIYATDGAGRVAGPLERFPLNGIGADKIHARTPSGAWEPIAYRIN